MADDLYPITVLIEELKNDDTQIRLNSIRRLQTIALALGEERTRSELLPFLHGEPLEDDEEILLAIAVELAKFIPLVGGPAHAHVIVPPLEKLAAVEETVVREQAVRSLNTIATEMEADKLQEHVVPMVQRLGVDVGWASRVSACGLFSVVLHKAGVSEESAVKMKELFRKLCEDDMPMVRKSAALNIGELVEGSTAKDVKDEYLPAFARLITDEQDNVRPVAVEAAVSFAKVLSEEDTMNTLVKPLHAASKDRSWRVRHVVAEKFRALQTACGLEISRSDLATMLVRLFRDQEKEVRMEAATQMPHLLEGMDDADRVAAFMHSVMPHVETLAADASQHVRIKLAAVLTDVAEIMGKERSIELIVPIFVSFLRDDHPETRMSVAGGIGKLNEIVGTEVVEATILPELVSLAYDAQWRVRLSISEQFPALGKALGEKAFGEHLVPVVMTWLTDNVYAIRQSACKVMSDLVAVFGEEWTVKTVVPKIKQMAHEGPDRTYNSRLTSLMVIQACATKAHKDALRAVLPIVMMLCKDPIPNVRFNASKTLEAIAPFVDKAVAAKDIKPQLETMIGDADGDVQYFSQSALSAY
eukprot:CAMPEP_0182924770 /NCGR_PEP_ID=MMETSP0105_2-20130417/7310_1 /TAXON_ID=81532 ORGANISM="Acanthoeca-like sp., Strain 10tr" /NCGR_SAMPLE_ID=MMETSP0105_2 /ASSEMBLY_ACC=CAM_ASM_000205 /LENGTH=586 /DNA_ID=CAMNT_0025062575 /DNA_START=40 /DNA_END=1800 /DNA_ORIENTATION=+